MSEKIQGKEGFEVEYFLAKLNMKYFLNLVWEDESLQDSFEIKEEIRNIDLNKILYEEIEYSISDDVRNYLHNIKDNKLFLSVNNEVDKLLEQIVNLKKLYDRGDDHSRFGSNYIYELAIEYNRLQLHLNKNRIIYNVFHDYKLLIGKIFKGFLESYLTKGEGLNSFNSSTLIEFLVNVDSTEFKKLFSKIELIKIDEDSEIKLVNTITNLLKSYYDNGIFANSPHKNRIFEEYLIDLQFSVEDNLALYHLQELGYFIKKKVCFFSPEQLIKILEIAIDRDKPNNNKYEGLIKDTSLALSKFFPNTKINNKRLINKVIGNIDGIHKWRSVSFLLNIVDDQCKQILNTEIEEMLDQEFHYEIYDDLIRKKLYDYRKKDYFKKYIAIIK